MSQRACWPWAAIFHKIDYVSPIDMAFFPGTKMINRSCGGHRQIAPSYSPTDLSRQEA
jgi:hypothetical protein